jgi:hypothetical protein
MRSAILDPEQVAEKSDIIVFPSGFAAGKREALDGP